MVHVILYYADWCGFCRELKAPNGPWEQFTKILKERGIKYEEVNTSDKSADLTHIHPEHKDGVPQIAAVFPSGKTKWQIGYTDSVPKLVKLLTEESVLRGSSRSRKSAAKKRLSAKPCRKYVVRKSVRKASMEPEVLQDLLWHVTEHCRHKTCKQDPCKAAKCAKKCCM